MNFKEFDLSDYFEALEKFKNKSEEDIIKNWGNIENFDLFIQKVKEDESKIAKCAINEFGSIQQFTEAMKYNMEHFSEIVHKQQSKEVKKIMRQSNELYQRLTFDIKKMFPLMKCSLLFRKLIHLCRKTQQPVFLGNDY